jgi:hypothetical protein
MPLNRFPVRKECSDVVIVPRRAFFIEEVA